jgi:hypothetical protein
VTDGELHLQLSDNSQYQILNGWADSVDRQSTKEVELVFEVPADTTWQGARLVFGTIKTEQTVLPLDGKAPVAQYPLKSRRSMLPSKPLRPTARSKAALRLSSRQMPGGLIFRSAR